MVLGSNFEEELEAGAGEAGAGDPLISQWQETIQPLIASPR